MESAQQQDSGQTAFVNLPTPQESRGCRGCERSLTSQTKGQCAWAGPAPDHSGVLCLGCWEVTYPPLPRNRDGFVVGRYRTNPNWQRDCRLRARGSVIARQA